MTSTTRNDFAFGCFFMCVIMSLGIISYIAIGRRPTDDSDFSAQQRSGLRVHTDAKTGVQYLSTLEGGLTPRLTAEGKVVIVKP